MSRLPSCANCTRSLWSFASRLGSDFLQLIVPRLPSSSNDSICFILVGRLIGTGSALPDVLQFVVFGLPRSANMVWCIGLVPARHSSDVRATNRLVVRSDWRRSFHLRRLCRDTASCGCVLRSTRFRDTLSNNIRFDIAFLSCLDNDVGTTNSVSLDVAYLLRSGMIPTLEALWQHHLRMYGSDFSWRQGRRRRTATGT